MIKYEELNIDFLINIVPEFEKEIRDEADSIGQFLAHCIYGNVLNPNVVTLLKRDDYLENEILHRIFEMYENFAVWGDAETHNLLQVTLLEYLWDEKTTYERAPEIMGPNTKAIWDCIQEYLLITTK